MKIVVFGGSGFIGQKVLEILEEKGHQIISVSRHGRPSNLTQNWADKITWVSSDILKDHEWQKYINGTDWLIDLIGILFENRKKNITYDQFIVQPVREITNFLKTNKSKSKLLFISANKGPFILKKYMQAKYLAEKIIQKQNKENLIVYPGLVFDSARPSSIAITLPLRILSHIPILNKLIIGYLPIKRVTLAKEINKIIDGEKSIYTSRR
ncbi:NAD(P)H-binding protein [Oenococcus sp. UCMA 16435]|nr:NAD(P)H-binding protein [Oenococcus sp. UCMA 16435]MDI4584494.1 NAD(P)H-binding protein [Oenococcus sp. UCMA 14587]